MAAQTSSRKGMANDLSALSKYLFAKENPWKLDGEPATLQPISINQFHEMYSMLSKELLFGEGSCY